VSVVDGADANAALGPRSGSQSVGRALAVLDCLARSRGELGVSDVAAQTGLTISTTHRLLRALVDAGLLGQDDRTSRYRLGPALVAMGRRAEAILGFDRLEPELRALAARTGESVDVGARVGDEVLVVLHVPSTQPLRFEPPAGSRLPMHTSALGKALLAFAEDPAAAVATLGRLGGRDRPGSSVPSTPDLLADLAATRRRGWAANDTAPDSGVRSIGVPLLRADGRPVAAIAVQGPEVRIPDDRVAELAGDLMRTAAALIGTSY
jgi:DNA-binding IclR family transcriptional regulator